MPRVFFGLELPAAVKQPVLQLQTPVAGARWQQAPQLHLTLVFLGQVPDARLPELTRAAASVRMAPFELTLQGLGTFGAAEHPRNLWAGVVPEAPVAALHRQLSEALRQAGFQVEQRRFRPHVTLSRFRRDSGSVQPLLDAHAGAVFGRWTVSEFVLFASSPGPEGSVYTVLKRFYLRA